MPDAAEHASDAYNMFMTSYLMSEHQQMKCLPHLSFRLQGLYDMAQSLSIQSQSVREHVLRNAERLWPSVVQCTQAHT